MAKTRIFYSPTGKFYWLGFWVALGNPNSSGFWQEIKRSKYKKVLTRFIAK